MDFQQVMKEERERLINIIADAERRKQEIDSEIADARRDLQAIDAYEKVKTGKVTRSGSRRSGVREEILSLFNSNPQGMQRSDILERMNVKGDKSGERSVSNALSALKKQGALDHLENGTYILSS